MGLYDFSGTKQAIARLGSNINRGMQIQNQRAREDQLRAEGQSFQMASEGVYQGEDPQLTALNDAIVGKKKNKRMNAMVASMVNRGVYDPSMANAENQEQLLRIAQNFEQAKAYDADARKRASADVETAFGHAKPTNIDQGRALSTMRSKMYQTNYAKYLASSKGLDPTAGEQIANAISLGATKALQSTIDAAAGAGNYDKVHELVNQALSNSMMSKADMKNRVKPGTFGEMVDKSGRQDLREFHDNMNRSENYYQLRHMKLDDAQREEVREIHSKIQTAYGEADRKRGAYEDRKTNSTMIKDYEKMTSRKEGLEKLESIFADGELLSKAAVKWGDIKASVRAMGLDEHKKRNLINQEFLTAYELSGARFGDEELATLRDTVIPSINDDSTKGLAMIQNLLEKVNREIRIKEEVNGPIDVNRRHEFLEEIMDRPAKLLDDLIAQSSFASEFEDEEMDDVDPKKAKAKIQKDKKDHREAKKDLGTFGVGSGLDLDEDYDPSGNLQNMDFEIKSPEEAGIMTPGNINPTATVERREPVDVAEATSIAETLFGSDIDASFVEKLALNAKNIVGTGEKDMIRSFEDVTGGKGYITETNGKVKYWFPNKSGAKRSHTPIEMDNMVDFSTRIAGSVAGGVVSARLGAKGMRKIPQSYRNMKFSKLSPKAQRRISAVVGGVAGSGLNALIEGGSRAASAEALTSMLNDNGATSEEEFDEKRAKAQQLVDKAYYNDLMAKSLAGGYDLNKEEFEWMDQFKESEGKIEYKGFSERFTKEGRDAIIGEAFGHGMKGLLKGGLGTLKYLKGSSPVTSIMDATRALSQNIHDSAMTLSVKNKSVAEDVANATFGRNWDEVHKVTKDAEEAHEVFQKTATDLGIPADEFKTTMTQLFAGAGKEIGDEMMEMPQSAAYVNALYAKGMPKEAREQALKSYMEASEQGRRMIEKFSDIYFPTSGGHDVVRAISEGANIAHRAEIKATLDGISGRYKQFMEEGLTNKGEKVKFLEMGNMQNTLASHIAKMSDGTTYKVDLQEFLEDTGGKINFKDAMDVMGLINDVNKGLAPDDARTLKSLYANMDKAVKEDLKHWGKDSSTFGDIEKEWAEAMTKFGNREGGLPGRLMTMGQSLAEVQGGAKRGAYGHLNFGDMGHKSDDVLRMIFDGADDKIPLNKAIDDIEKLIDNNPASMKVMQEAGMGHHPVRAQIAKARFIQLLNEAPKADSAGLTSDITKKMMDAIEFGFPNNRTQMKGMMNAIVKYNKTIAMTKPPMKGGQGGQGAGFGIPSALSFGTTAAALAGTRSVLRSKAADTQVAMMMIMHHPEKAKEFLAEVGQIRAKTGSEYATKFESTTEKAVKQIFGGTIQGLVGGITKGKDAVLNWDKAIANGLIMNLATQYPSTVVKEYNRNEGSASNPYLKEKDKGSPRFRSQSTL